MPRLVTEWHQNPLTGNITRFLSINWKSNDYARLLRLLQLLLKNQNINAHIWPTYDKRGKKRIFGKYSPSIHEALASKLLAKDTKYAVHFKQDRERSVAFYGRRIIKKIHQLHDLYKKKKFKGLIQENIRALLNDLIANQSDCKWCWLIKIKHFADYNQCTSLRAQRPPSHHLSTLKRKKATARYRSCKHSRVRPWMFLSIKYWEISESCPISSNLLTYKQHWALKRWICKIGSQVTKPWERPYNPLYKMTKPHVQRTPTCHGAKILPSWEPQNLQALSSK